MKRVKEYVGIKTIEAVNYDGNENNLYNMWLTDKEIIRCKDCKGSEEGSWFKCDTFLAHGEDPNGFCSWPERKNHE